MRNTYVHCWVTLIYNWVHVFFRRNEILHRWNKFCPSSHGWRYSLAMCNGHFLVLLMYFSIISLRPVASCGRGDRTWRVVSGLRKVIACTGLTRNRHLPSLLCLLPCAGREWVGSPANTEKEVCLVDTGGFSFFKHLVYLVATFYVLETWKLTLVSHSVISGPSYAVELCIGFEVS